MYLHNTSFIHVIMTEIMKYIVSLYDLSSYILNISKIMCHWDFLSSIYSTVWKQVWLCLEITCM